jgi:hypothetical protein
MAIQLYFNNSQITGLASALSRKILRIVEMTYRHPGQNPSGSETVHTCLIPQLARWADPEEIGNIYGDSSRSGKKAHGKLYGQVQAAG